MHWYFLVVLAASSNFESVSQSKSPVAEQTKTKTSDAMLSHRGCFCHRSTNDDSSTFQHTRTSCLLYPTRYVGAKHLTDQALHCSSIILLSMQQQSPSFPDCYRIMCSCSFGPFFYIVVNTECRKHRIIKVAAPCRQHSETPTPPGTMQQ